MNRRLVGIFAATAIAFTPLAACGTPNNPRSTPYNQSSDAIVGVITEKEHDKAKTKKSTKQKCTSKRVNGKTKKTCKTVPTTKREKEEWELTIQIDGGGEEEVDVSRQVYDSVQVGDRFDSSRQ